MNIDTLKNLSSKTKTIIGVGIVLFLIVVISLSKLSGIKSDGVDYETQLSAQYSSNQVELSNYVSTFYETVNIAGAKSEKINDILIGAITARNAGTVEGQAKGSLFYSITEAYPEVNGLDAYDKIVDFVVDGRRQFTNKQNQLLDRRRSYEKWRNSGLFHPVLVSIAGFPSDNVKTNVGGKTLKGQDALDQMDILVLTTGTDKAFETGEQAPLTIPEG